MTTPRPTVIEVPLKIPLCDSETEKSVQEDLFWRLILSFPTMQALSQSDYEYQNDVTDMDKNLKQAIIKLFAVS